MTRDEVERARKWLEEQDFYPPDLEHEDMLAAYAAAEVERLTREWAIVFELHAETIERLTRERDEARAYVEGRLGVLEQRAEALSLALVAAVRDECYSSALVGRCPRTGTCDDHMPGRRIRGRCRGKLMPDPQALLDAARRRLNDAGH